MKKLLSNRIKKIKIKHCMYNINKARLKRSEHNSFINKNAFGRDLRDTGS